MRRARRPAAVRRSAVPARALAPTLDPAPPQSTDAMRQLVAPPHTSRPAPAALRALQRSIGNSAVSALLARRAARPEDGPAARLAGQGLLVAPHDAQTEGRLQRTAEKIGVCYYNGEKDLYTLTGREGKFIKAAQQLRPGFTTYKKVVPAEGTGPQGQPKYALAAPPVTVEEDDRTPQQRWTAAVGGGSFGDNYFVLPGSSYPHLSVEYHLEDNQLIFGDAHYSRSQDDSRRLTYRRSAAGWTYEHDIAGPGHEQAKQAADALIGRMTRAL